MQGVSTLYSFFLAMTLHPEVQAKAQAELDAYLGQDRLPEFADEEYLPYVRALVMELQRWIPVTPMRALTRQLMSPPMLDASTFQFFPMQRLKTTSTEDTTFRRVRRSLSIYGENFMVFYNCSSSLSGQSFTIRKYTRSQKSSDLLDFSEFRLRPIHGRLLLGLADGQLTSKVLPVSSWSLTKKQNLCWSTLC